MKEINNTKSLRHCEELRGTKQDEAIQNLTPRPLQVEREPGLLRRLAMTMFNVRHCEGAARSNPGLMSFPDCFVIPFLAMTKGYKYLLLLCALAWALPSCTAEQPAGDDRNGGGAAGNEVEVRMSVLLPGIAAGKAGVTTRAATEADENKVETIDILAFTKDGTKPSGWAYAYATHGRLITGTGKMKQFTTSVVMDAAEQAFVLLANVRSYVEGLNPIAAGADKDALLEQLIAAQSGKWPAETSFPTPFPMWGEVRHTVSSATTDITGILMLRSVARLEAAVVPAVANFTLNEIHIYNSKNKGYIVPHPDNLENSMGALGKVYAATVPSSASTYAAWNNPAPLVYAVPPAMNTNFERTIYLFEAQAAPQTQPADATCMIIGGTYGADASPTYYRVDFFADNGDYRDILRNHHYLLRITDVGGSGYATPALAFAGRPLNMEFEILEWDESGMGNIAFDGSHTLSVSQDEFRFFREERTVEEEDNILYAYTDDPAGWHIEKIVDETDTPVAWLTATPAAGTAGVQTKVVLTYTANATPAARTAIVWFASGSPQAPGRLRYPVTVTQLLASAIKLEIVDPVTGLPLEELLFESAVGIAPPPQQFRVNWSPAAADLTVVNTVLGSMPFSTEPGSGTPTGGIPVPGGTGTVTYTISPPAITAQEISLYSFVEKVSKIDFVVGNGVSYLSKTIFLRQAYYNFKVTPQNYSIPPGMPDGQIEGGSYLLDGSTHTLLVQSNETWRIKSIEKHTKSISNRIDQDEMLALKPSDNLRVDGTIYPANTFPGTPVTFTVVNDKTFWGSMTVTFESPDGKFPDKSITLIFALPKVKVMGLTTATNHYGYNVARSGTDHDVNRMLATAGNFGLNLTSTVYSRGFDFIMIDETPSMSAAELQSYISRQPDIIVLGYDIYIQDAQRANIYLAYMQRGGVLLAINEGGGNAGRNLMRAVFNDQAIDQHGVNPGGAVYGLPSVSAIDDPVTNGPFGDVRGRHWGEDASVTCGLSGLPAGQIIVYSTGEDRSGNSSDADKSRITAFRHSTLPLVFFGDGGFLSSDNAASHTICPFLLNSAKAPVPKPDYGRSASSRFDVYNSVLFANMMAWAISATDYHP